MPSAPSQSRPDDSAARAAVLFADRELRLPAEPSELVGVREYVSRAASDFGLDEAGRRDFVFAANEAVTNAIRHGTPDADGTILVRITGEGELLTLAVSDSGPFDTDVGDDDRLAESGRGFKFMTRLVDEIQLSIGPGHTTVRLHKRRA
jgi:anti-sigma regulatory factor (Ser/Thr protein kinase)